MKHFNVNISCFFMALTCCIPYVAARELPVPSLLLVPGKAISIGPVFLVVEDYNPSDTLSMAVGGAVDLASGQFTANAAGIIVGPATTNTGNHPGQTSPNLNNPGTNLGALLLGNDVLGFHQVLPSIAAYGLGNPMPPTTLVLKNEPLSSIFGPSFTGLTSGTVLEFRVSDNFSSSDNSGAFVIFQSRTAATSAAAMSYRPGFYSRSVDLVHPRRRFADMDLSKGTPATHLHQERLA